MYLDRLILLYTSFLVGLVTVTEDEPLLSPPSLSLCWELEMEMDTVILHFSYPCFLPFDVGQEKLQYHCGI